MYSMNLTSAHTDAPNSRRSSSSLSLTPRATTGVNLRTHKPEIGHGADALEDVSQVIPLCHRSEARRLHGVETDRDSPQASGEQFCGEPARHDAVCGQCKIANGWLGGEQAYQPHDVPSQQRLSASNPNLVDPLRGVHVGEATKFPRW